jgi:hypothetical protein
MGYVKAASGEEIGPATLEAMARLLGIAVPSEETAPLATAVRDQLVSIESLEDLDLTDIMPAVEFDPRWES